MVRFSFVAFLAITAAFVPCVLSLFPIEQVVHASSTSGELQLRVRDSLTGSPLAARIITRDDLGDDVGSASELGRAVLRSTGRTTVKVEMYGYSPIETQFVIDANTLDVTVWLDPTDISERLSREDDDVLEGKTIFEGFAYSADGSPLAYGKISVGGKTAVTDPSGAFRLEFATPPMRPDRELPEEAVLELSRAGSVVYRRENVMVETGKTRLIIDVPAEGEVSFDARHKIRLSQDQPEPKTEEPVVAAPVFLTAPAAVPVPASIRVGSNCATATTCTSVNVYAIDTYVRNGLDDEWIASWNANSVKAGAIAYRSYGSYHVFHPRVPASYDICNTTSCQVNDPSDTHVNSNNATVQTTGTIVTNAAGTDALFSEYSAENNLAPGCPDGSTGRPEHNWPCLADPVDVGTTYFGHGRGMCQWGSQRWSINQGKDFVWIVNHYYNANGNPSGLRNGVLQMGPDTLLPPPELVLPGDQTAPGPSVATLTPTFTWAPVAGADGYSLYVSRFNGSTYDVVFNSETALSQPITATSFTLPAGILVGGAQYRWNMSSHIPAGYGTPNTFRNYFAVSPTVSVSGRVTSPSGTAIRNAAVSLIDDQGVRRSATSSSFGIFSFSGVGIGRTYTISVANKRYRFTAQVVQVNSDLSDIVLVGQE